MKKLYSIVAAGAMLLGTAGVSLGASTADVIFVVDESGSMGGEHSWLSTMINSLETSLGDAGVTNNRYSLVGFGGSNSSYSPHPALAPHTHDMDTSTAALDYWGSSSDFATATGSLVTNGGFEDGWAAIDYIFNASSNYTFRSGAAVNVVLVTDEDRDAYDTSLSYASVLESLTDNGAMLNAVVNANLYDKDGDRAIGVDSTLDAFIQDGAGFTTDTGGYVGYSYGTTKQDYIDMAWATGGATWDLNILRNVSSASAFTAAFVDIKTQEIINDPGHNVPEPATMLLFGTGLAGLAGYRRKIKK